MQRNSRALYKQKTPGSHPFSEHHGRRLDANWSQCLDASFKTIHIHAHTHTHTHTHTNLQVVHFVVVGVFNVKESDHLLHAVPEHTLQFLRGETHGHNVGLDVWNTHMGQGTLHIHTSLRLALHQRIWIYKSQFLAESVHKFALNAPPPPQ